MTDVQARDAGYVDIILERVRVSASYKPKFGQGGRVGLTLREFRGLYSADPFYAWFGLDDAMLYAAHKAAGGMTSIYRQIGIGCERVFRQILEDELACRPPTRCGPTKCQPATAERASCRSMGEFPWRR